jgi:DNA-directed RNA polymerase specialized sigma subunit
MINFSARLDQMLIKKGSIFPDYVQVPGIPSLEEAAGSKADGTKSTPSPNQTGIQVRPALNPGVPALTLEDLALNYKNDPSPDNAQAFLDAAKTSISKSINYAVGNNQSPVVKSKAKELALRAAETYDPSFGTKMETHMINTARGLRRTLIEANNILDVPENTILTKRKIDSITQELEDELGREPSDLEISDRLGINLGQLARSKKYKSGMTPSMLDTGDPERMPMDFTIDQSAEKMINRIKLLYETSDDPIDRYIMEKVYPDAFGGGERLMGREIADMLNMTPAAVSQRLARIDKRINDIERLDIV